MPEGEVGKSTPSRRQPDARIFRMHTSLRRLVNLPTHLLRSTKALSPVIMSAEKENGTSPTSGLLRARALETFVKYAVLVGVIGGTGLYHLDNLTPV